MAESDPLADVITLLAAPIAGAVRSVEQFRTGVDEFLRGIENFNRTMASLNETAERMNRLLEQVEEPIRVAVPQVTRAVRAADEVMQVVSGPAIAAAPAVSRLAETLATPAFQQLPDQLAQFNDLLTNMSTRMAPLTQFAETAGGLFGMRVPGRSPTRPAPAGGDADSSGATDAPTAETAPPSSASKRSSSATSSPRTSSSKSSAATSSSKRAASKKSTTASKRSGSSKRSDSSKRSGSSGGSTGD
jgi:hypothetical protein